MFDALLQDLLLLIDSKGKENLAEDVDSAFVFLNTLYGQVIFNGVIVAGALFLLTVWLVATKLAASAAEKSDNKLDNIAVASVRAPVAWMVVLLAAYLIIADVAFFLFGYSIPAVLSVLSYAVFFVLIWCVLRFIKQAETKIVVEGERILPKFLHSKVKLDRHSMRIIIFSLRFSVIGIGVFVLLSLLGVSLAGLLAFGGLGGIVLGFALRDPLSNFFAGALLFWEKPFVIGDWIRCPEAGVEGVVHSITWRTTLIKTFDRRPIFVPNSLLVNNYVENPQRMTNRRIYETFGVRYEDIDRLPALLKDVRAMLKEHKGIDDTQTLVVAFDEYAEYSLNVFLCAITYATTWEEFQTTKEDILLKVAVVVKKHGADFAYPTTNVMLEGAGGRGGVPGAGGRASSAGGPAAEDG